MTARVGGVEAGAYEIHLGRTEIERALPAFAQLADGGADGGADGVVDERVMGTYLHGVLEHEAVARMLFGESRESGHDSYDELAGWFERHANLKLFEECFL